MTDRDVWRRVLDLMSEWTPSQEYDHEREYQSDLQEYLDVRLNNPSGTTQRTASEFDQSGNYPVHTERGNSYGDVVVDDIVGIELKRNFTNSQKRRLRGQLEDYGEEYDFVIACACGIEDIDGWREVENKLKQSPGGYANQTEFQFFIKRREEFGSDANDDLGEELIDEDDTSRKGGDIPEMDVYGSILVAAVVIGVLLISRPLQGDLGGVPLNWIAIGIVAIGGLSAAGQQS